MIKHKYKSKILVFCSLGQKINIISVFKVGVNPDLYFLVFGESLLNDGVAVVLYNMMNAFAGTGSLIIIV